MPTLFQVMASVFLMDAMYEFSLWGLPYADYVKMSLMQSALVNIGYLFLLSIVVIMYIESLIKKMNGLEKRTYRND